VRPIFIRAAVAAVTAPSGCRSGLVQRYALPPAEIERRSLQTVTEALAAHFTDPAERAVAVRIAYAAGDLSLADALRFTPGAVAAGVRALCTGAAVVADVRMLVAGLDRGRLERLACPLLCSIDVPEVAEAARRSGLPRAVEAIRLLAPRLSGAVVAIGNAPTALLALLDLIDEGLEPPALIVGLPVGFVAAAESKHELAARSLRSVTLLGTRGGSPLAAATVNALLRLAADAGPA
jgi:precorrin-8X/cobalt-precorrin-8 methylmutase